MRTIGACSSVDIAIRADRQLELFAMQMCLPLRLVSATEGLRLGPESRMPPTLWIELAVDPRRRLAL